MKIDGKLNMLRPQKYPRSSFLCYYAVSPTLKLHLLGIFQELIKKKHALIMNQELCRTKNYLFNQLKTDTSSVFANNLRPTCATEEYSPMLTLMAHEHAAVQLEYFQYFLKPKRMNFHQWI